VELQNRAKKRKIKQKRGKMSKKEENKVKECLKL
jgi:hypothetical protein